MSITIPRAEDVKTGGSGMKNWRFADGQLLRGREEDGTLTDTPRIVGVLKRIGIHRGTVDDGRSYGKLECELETSDGIESVGANLTSMMASITFGEGLLAAALGELIAIDAGRSKELNRYKKFTTYANVYKVDPKTLDTTPIKKKVLTKDLSLDDAWEKIEEKLLEHPAWAERPKRETDANGDPASDYWSALETECAGHWPLPSQIPIGYLEMAKAIHKATAKTEPPDWKALDEVPADIIQEIRKGLAQSKASGSSAPKFLKDAQDNAEYDPFAE